MCTVGHRQTPPHIHAGTSLLYYQVQPFWHLVQHPIQVRVLIFKQETRAPVQRPNRVPHPSASGSAEYYLIPFLQETYHHIPVPVLPDLHVPIGGVPEPGVVQVVKNVIPIKLSGKKYQSVAPVIGSTSTASMI